jgi:hypothetical protein
MTTKEQSAALAEYCRQHIDTWKTSDQSRSEFCRVHELNYHRFLYWQRKLRNQERQDTNGGFASVTRRSGSVPGGLSIVLPRGLVLQGISASNLPVVYQLLSHLS